MRVRTSSTFTTSTRTSGCKTPKSNESKLLDSQTITPGEGFTLEMIYGSGNRNLTAGDSIFHCHFYPHFAAGLWAMWRVHDVYEGGTALDKDGRPLPGARALPDGEIAEGTPIPGLVPMPALAMAPIPPPIKLVPTLGEPPAGGGKAPVLGYHAELADPTADAGKNPGYPFFIPGEAGHRPPNRPWTSPRRMASGSTAACLDTSWLAAQWSTRSTTSSTSPRRTSPAAPTEG